MSPCRNSLVALVVLIFAGGSPAADYAWGTAATGNWNAAGNWVPAAVPGAADNALIAAAGTYTVNLTDNRSVSNLTLNAVGATLGHTSGTLNIGGAFNLQSGRYALNGANLSAGFGPGTFTTAAGTTFNWFNTGFVEGISATIGGNANLQLNVGRYVANQSTLTLAGNTTWGGGGILVEGPEVTTPYGASTVRIPTGGIVTATGATLFGSTASNHYFVNFGSTGGTFEIAGTVRKTGDTDALTLYGGVEYRLLNGAALQAVDLGSVINLGAGVVTVAGTSTVSGSGLVSLNGSELRPSGTATLDGGSALVWGQSFVRGTNNTGTLNLAGSPRLAGNVGRGVYGAGTLTVTGSPTWSGGGILVDGPNLTLGASTFRVAAGAELTATADTLFGSTTSNFYFVNFGTAGGLVDIAGTVRKTGDTGALTWYGNVEYRLQNGAVLQAVDLGSVISMIQGPATVSGTVTASGSGVVSLNGTELRPSGTANLSGGPALVWGQSFVRGTNGTGTLNLAGTPRIAGEVGRGVYGAGTVAVTGTPTWSGGGILVDGPNLSVGASTFRVAPGGVLTATADTRFGSTASNFYFVNFGTTGGVVDIAGTLRKTGSASTNTWFGGLSYDVTGTVDVQGGAVLISSAADTQFFSSGSLLRGTWLVTDSVVNFDGRQVSTLGAQATVDLSGATAQFAALQALTQNNGTLRLRNGQVFTPTAATVNTAGLLSVGSASTFGKAVVVQNGGVLRGGGQVGGTVTAQSGGTVAPGPAGILFANAGVTLGTGSTFAVGLNGATSGSGYDQLAVTGIVTLNSPTLSPTLTYTPAAGDKLFVLVNDGTDPIIGTFSGLPDGSTFPIGAFTAQISYSGDASLNALTGGNDVVIYLVPVPEPTTCLATAAVALVGGRRLRRTLG